MFSTLFVNMYTKVYTFLRSFILVSFLHVFEEFSFILKCDYKICAKKIYTLHLLARDKLTLNNPDSW